jgi:hypothetical protein
MTYKEAKSLLEEYGISFASVIADRDVKDTANAFIYRQNPERFDEEKVPRYIQSGQVMDIWLSPVMKSPKDSLDKK